MTCLTSASMMRAVSSDMCLALAVLRPEDFTVLFCVKHGAETLGHAPLGHHLAGDVGGTFDVVGCTGRYLSAP